MDEKRILIALALMYVLVLAVRWLAPPPATRDKARAPDRAVASAPPSPAAPARSPEPAPATPPAVEPAVSDEAERRVEVETPVWRLAFTNRGARLLSWRLSEYTNERGETEEMTPPARGDGPWPLEVVTDDAQIDARLRGGLYVSSTASLKVAVGQAGELTFRYADGSLSAIKTLRFNDGYLLSVAVSVRREGREIAKRVVWGPGIATATAEEAAVRGYEAPQLVYRGGATVHRVAAPKLVAQSLDAVSWAGVESKYFAALFVPAGRSVIARSHEATTRAADAPVGKAPVVEADLGTATEPVELFVGPKDYRLLARMNNDLRTVVDVGDWIGPIVVPMMSLLRTIHGWVGNYGWSIVLLTIGINLVLGPLRHMSIANGIKMSKLAPEMRTIQDRYRRLPALDPKRQEMHREVQALYARHGMSMSSQMTVGCLPMLLTLPFLFAIYRVLTVSIDMRGAAFLWIPDLSHKDPIYVIPVLMGLTMLAMQKMMPSAMDPAQQRIMMVMPLMFTVMFVGAPAGMNLYWLTSNICSIVQQSITMRLVRPAAAPAPKGKRP